MTMAQRVDAVAHRVPPEARSRGLSGRQLQLIGGVLIAGSAFGAVVTYL